MPKPNPDAKPAPLRTISVESVRVSSPPTVAKKFVYTAYGESLAPIVYPPDRPMVAQK
jgi:hypothetical protein